MQKARSKKEPSAFLRDRKNGRMAGVWRARELTVQDEIKGSEGASVLVLLGKDHS